MIKHVNLIGNADRQTVLQTVEDIKKADADPDVTGIALNIDSPGGEVSDIPLLVEAVTACTKPIEARILNAARNGITMQVKDVVLGGHAYKFTLVVFSAGKTGRIDTSGKGIDNTCSTVHTMTVGGVGFERSVHVACVSPGASQAVRKHYAKRCKTAKYELSKAAYEYICVRKGLRTPKDLEMDQWRDYVPSA